MSDEIRGEDVVLLIAGGATGSFEFDPIRLMKGAFLVAQRGPDEWRDFFDFSPYSYGPFDSGVYVMRDTLLSQGLLRAEKHGRYESYSITDDGRNRLEELKELLPEHTAKWVSSVGSYVTSKSFSRLLREIYGAFPERVRLRDAAAGDGDAAPKVPLRGAPHARAASELRSAAPPRTRRRRVPGRAAEHARLACCAVRAHGRTRGARVFF